MQKIKKEKGICSGSSKGKEKSGKLIPFQAGRRGLQIPDYFFQGFEVEFESYSAFGRNKETRIGLSTDERFFDAEIACNFQCAGMSCQVTVCEVEEFFQCVEIHKVIDHEGGHDSQTGTALEGFVQVLQVIFHG